jgi:hypothetical protein
MWVQRQKQSEGEEGWIFCGSNITYTPETESTDANNRQRNSRSNTYVLTFTVQFLEGGDTVYFAYCLPYSFTDLQTFLEEVCEYESRSCQIDHDKWVLWLGEWLSQCVVQVLTFVWLPALSLSA